MNWTNHAKSLLGALCFIKMIFPPICWGAGYEFEGLGAKQVSRAGAAIAEADDWTAIYWNPGNIVKVAHKSGSELGIELFGGEAFEKDSNSLSSLPGLGAIFSKDDLHLNSLLGAIGAIFSIGKKGGIGFGFYTPLLQGSKFSNASATTPSIKLDLDNSVGILTWTLSGSYEISSQWSAGAGLNLLYGRIKNDITLGDFPFATNNTLSNDLKGDGLGLEGIFGLQYNPVDRFSLGAVYRTGSDVNLKGNARLNNSAAFSSDSDEESNFTYELRHPPTWGLGSAYRPTKQLRLTLDYNRTLWHRFKSNIVYDSPGSFLTNAPNSFHWKDSWKIRFGVLYGISAQTDILGGYSHDSPALDAGSLDLATSPDVPMNRFSTGVAHAWSDRFETTAGIIGGMGKRTEGNVTYRLSGYQVMIESRFRF